MKKIIIPFVVLLVLVVTACNTTKNNAVTTTAAPQQEQTPGKLPKTVMQESQTKATPVSNGKKVLPIKTMGVPTAAMTPDTIIGQN